MRNVYFLMGLVTLINSAPAIGSDDLSSEQLKLEQLLSGAKLEGIYLRTNSPYTLIFDADGSLKNQRGETGRWWVNPQGQYCRLWETGKLKGHQACLDLIVESEGVSIYSRGKRVAEGELKR
jgi:Tfp pilus assembly protein FimT